MALEEGMTKAKLLQEMRDARAEWETLLVQVDDARMTQAGAAGHWSVKDIIAHITEYERWLVLGFALRRQKPPDLWIRQISLGEQNELIYQQARNRPLTQVLADSEQVFQELVREVERLPEEYLTQPQQVEGVPFTVIPWKYIRSESYNHYRDHIPSIREWLKSLDKSK